MEPEQAVLQKAFSRIITGFGKNHARIYWSLINNVSKSAKQIEKETSLAHETVYLILKQLKQQRLIGFTNTRPKFYYCQPTLKTIRMILRQQKNNYLDELETVLEDIKKIINNATSQSGEKYLIEVTEKQTTITNYQTKQPVTYKHEIDEIKQKIDKITAKTREKDWQITR